MDDDDLYGFWVFKPDRTFRWQATIPDDILHALVEQKDPEAWKDFIEVVERRVADCRRCQPL